MSLSTAEKAFLSSMSPADLDSLKDMTASKAKTIVKDMVEANGILDMVPSPPSKRNRDDHEELRSYEIKADHNGCLVCGNTSFSESLYSLRYVLFS